MHMALALFNRAIIGNAVEVLVLFKETLVVIQALFELRGDADDIPVVGNLVGILGIQPEDRPRNWLMVMEVVTEVRSIRTLILLASQPSPSSPRVPTRQRVIPFWNRSVIIAIHTRGHQSPPLANR